jgi:XTP/dITP diphosphohydrolase
MDLPVIIWVGRRSLCAAAAGAFAMTPQSLLVATRNKGKLAELRRLLRDLPLSLCDLDSFPSIETIIETGKTFTENAALKSAGYAEQARMLTLADDSGLEIDALHGMPGVFSARYAGDGATDADRVNKLLNELAAFSESERTARFVSVAVVADATGRILNVSTGTCNGRIGFEPKGRNGFGYDPIFIPDGFEHTFAEISPEVKNQISHRARALAGTREFLRSLTAS